MKVEENPHKNTLSENINYTNNKSMFNIKVKNAKQRITSVNVLTISVISNAND